MSYVCKFTLTHKRILGYFGYTLLEAQSLPEDEKLALHDRIQRAMLSGDTYEPAQLFDEDGLIADDNYLALDSLCSMIYWLPAHTVLTNDNMPLDDALIDDANLLTLTSSMTTALCVQAPIPACNYSKDTSIANIGFAQGILEDGMPFVAELYSMDPGSLGMNIILPEIPQYISNANVGTASDFPDSVAEAQDNGILTLGMTLRDRNDSLEELMYYTQYLEDMGVLTFTTSLQEGDLETLSDLDGNPVVLDRITLVDDGIQIARTHLRFMPFPDGPNRFFEDEWLRDNFDDDLLVSLLDGLLDVNDRQATPPNCVFEDDEWRPCPYDDAVDNVFYPSEGGQDGR